MASDELTIHIRTRRPRMWPVAHALKPLWRVLPAKVAHGCIFALLGTQYSVNDGKTWRDARRGHSIDLLLRSMGCRARSVAALPGFCMPKLYQAGGGYAA